MRSILVLTFCMYLTWGCTHSGTLSPVYSEALPVSVSSYPDSESHDHPPFVKVVQDNALISTGTFISDNGLLISSYDPVLRAMAAISSEDSMLIATGFSAGMPENELPLEGLTLHIEIEQRDVTAELNAGLEDSSFNYEIYTHIENAKKELIAESTAGREDLIAIIHDQYAGNRFLLTVYRVVDDIRLVFAPGLQVDPDNLSDSEYLSSQVRSSFSLLRAYNEAGETYTPPAYLTLSERTPAPFDTVSAAGYPSRTYRHDSHIAFNFYYKHTNPYLLLNYKNYLAKEERLAASSLNYALSSATRRIQTYDNMRWYDSVQKGMVTDSLIMLKEQQADEFRAWADQDSLRQVEYGNIYTFIGQAFDIAGKSGDIFFATNYFMSLSLLDEVTGLYRNLIQTYEGAALPQQAVEQTINVHQQVLEQINVESEMDFFGDALLMIQTVPEDQIPLAIFDLFEGLDEPLKMKLINNFKDEQLSQSFLFDTSKARSVVKDRRFYNDRLFVILDEIMSTRDFAQNNYQRHYGYLYPAQQVLLRGKLARNPDLTTDMDGYLFTNSGTVLPQDSPEHTAVVSSIDLSAKAPGAAIMSTDGTLSGIHVSTHPEYASNNYLYRKHRSRLSILTSDTILKIISDHSETSNLLKELESVPSFSP